MAIASYASDSALDRRVWSRKTQIKMNNRLFFRKMGMEVDATGSKGIPDEDLSMPVVRYDELSEGKNGARIRIPWVNQLTGPGKTANNTLEGQEEEIKFGYFDVVIDRLRHATGYEGVLSEIRNQDLNPDTAKMLLMNWAIQRREEGCWNALYKGGSAHLITAGHVTAADHPNTYYYDNSGDVDGIEGLAADVHNMDTEVLEAIIERYEDSTNPIPYIDVEGEELGVVVIHTKQARSLRQDSRFMAMQRDIYERTSANGAHPLHQNAKFRYMNLLIYVSNRVYTAAQASVAGGALEAGTSGEYGAVMLGPRAIGCANGGFPNGMGTGESGPGYDQLGNIATKFVYSDDTDYENKVKIGIDMIWADKRADFIKEEGGTINESSAIFWTKEA